MWASVLLYSLVGLTAADNGWKVGLQYKYNLEARTLTGQHQTPNQFTGSIIRGKLRVFADSANQITLQVQDAEHADVNQMLPEGWSSNIPESDVNYISLPAKNKPFQLYLSNGTVQKMVVDKDIPNWEQNLLKGIASQLQVDIKGKNLKYSKLNNVPEDNQDSGIFSTMEECINGKYETIYDVSVIPEYILQSKPELVPLEHLKGEGGHYRIVKTRNFSNSDQHVVYRFGMSGQEGWSEGTNTMGNFLTRSSQSTIIYSGNHSRFTIQSAETTEIVLVAPHIYNNQKGIVVSSIKLSLEKVKTSNSSSPLISNPKTVESLVYEYQPGTNQDDVEVKESSSKESSSSMSSEESSNSNSKSEEEQVEVFIKKGNKRKIRSTESMQSVMKEDSDRSSHSSSTSSDSSIGSSEETVDPQPDLNEAPNIEFLPDNTLSPQKHEKEQILKKIEKVSKQIGNLLNDPNEIPNNNVLSRFSILTRLVMSASTEQLLKASEKLYQPERKTEGGQHCGSWKAYRDAVAQAGTGPALVTLAAWIESGKVQGNEAAQLLAVLPTAARYPTTEYMNKFFELVKCKTVRNQKFLNDTAILSFSDLVRRAQVNRQSSHHRYPIHLSGAQSHNHRAVVVEQYIPYLQSQLENAIKEEDSIKIQVYTRALGKTAHPKLLRIFEPYLEGKRAISKFQRLLMVVSLCDFVKVYPKTARSVLYSIYKNQFDVPELRIAAVMLIMKTNPSAHLLQRLAEHTNYDQSKQVNAAVKSAIETAANSDYIADPTLVNNARSAMSFLTPEDYGARYSKHLIYSRPIKEVENVHYTAYGSSIQGTDGIYPDTILFNQNYNIGGYFPEQFTASYMTSGAEQILNLLLKRLELENDPQVQQRDDAKANDTNSTGYTFQYISDMLNWRSNEPTQVEGNVFGTVLGGERFFPFDRNTVEQLPETFREINRNIQKGIDYQESKFYNHYSVEMGFPLATGMQFTYSISVPTYLHLSFDGNGYLHQTQEYTTNNNVPISGGINGKLKFVWSNQKQGKMGFTAQYSQKRYLTVLEKNTQLYLPINGNLDVNWYNIRSSLKFLDDQKDFQKIFQSKTNVYTTYQNISDVIPYLEGSNVQMINIRPKRIFQNTFGEEQTGYRFRIETESENNFQDTGKAFYAFLQHGPDIFSNILYDDISNNYLVFSYDSKNSSPHETTLSFTYRDHGPEISKMVSEIRKKKSKSRKDASKRNDLEDRASSEETSTAEDCGNYTTQMSLFAASVSFGGNEENAKYVATLVHADSPVSTSSRYLLYYSGEPFQKSEENNEFQATAEIIIKKPQLAIFNFDNALNDDKTTVIEGEISFNEQDQSKLKFRGEMLQSDKRKEFLRNQPSTRLCKQLMTMGNHMNPTCTRLIENAHYLDTYNVSINYDFLPTVIKKIGQAFYGMVRHYGSDHNDEEVIDVLNTEGQINLGVQFNDNLRTVNVSIGTPYLQSNFQNVDVEDWAQPLVVQHTRYSPLQLFARKIIYSEQTPTCSLAANTVSTFNNRSYPVNLGDCFHVLAMSVPFRRIRDQETSQQYDYDQRNFSILVKDVGTKKKMVQILLADDVLTLEPAGSKGVTFSVNGRRIQISENKITGWLKGKNELHAHTLRNGNALVLDIKSHGMQLIYDGRSLQLTMSSHYSNKVRGLCGVFDGERDNDFITPGNCIMKNHRDFAASYAINDDSCRGSAKEMHILARNVPCYSKEVIPNDVISETEAGRRNRSERLTSLPRKKRVQTSCYIILVKTIQDGGDTCFSIDQQLLCNFHCKETKTALKPVDFLCLPDSVATKHWQSMINSGINPDFSNQKANRHMNITLPVNCEIK